MNNSKGLNETIITRELNNQHSVVNTRSFFFRFNSTDVANALGTSEKRARVTLRDRGFNNGKPRSAHYQFNLNEFLRAAYVLPTAVHPVAL